MWYRAWTLDSLRTVAALLARVLPRSSFKPDNRELIFAIKKKLEPSWRYL
jgi:hypothetical protein